MNKLRAKGLSLVELLLVVSIIGLLASILLPALGRAQEAARRAACLSNLKQFGLAFKMYASEARGELWPPMQAAAFRLTNVRASLSFSPRLDSMWPEYTSDLGLWSCPSDPDSPESYFYPEEAASRITLQPWVAGRSYTYFGWALDKTQLAPVSLADFPELAALPALIGESASGGLEVSGINAQLAAAGVAWLAQNERLSAEPLYVQTLCDSDLPGLRPHPLTMTPLGNGESDILYRLREGVERRFSETASQSDIWVMFDAFGKGIATPLVGHPPGGANVLYLDGHADWIPYGSLAAISQFVTGEPGEPPMTPSMALTMGFVASLR